MTTQTRTLTVISHNKKTEYHFQRLTPEQQRFLDDYYHCPPEVQDAILKLAEACRIR